ncbi:MAG: magnesium/cobalt transporter CorA [Gammaproteobacteria bacterium]
MFREVRKRASKVGQPPGTATFTGLKKSFVPRMTMVTYSEQQYHVATGTTLEECTSGKISNGLTWINIQGLQNVGLIQQLAALYKIHPLTIEDILNVQQRPKVEEFENYEFITLKIFLWQPKKLRFAAEQLSILLGKDFVISFQESDTPIFKNINERLCSESTQRLRQQGSDYLAYRLIDTVVDYYFLVLEGLGNQIDKIEEKIISDPAPQNTRTIYRLKRQMLFLRKSIWPMREVISHLLQGEEKLISAFTRLYMRDLYDHVVQAIDTIETFRDMLSNLLDVYLSSLTNRMNEVMKTLTIIATIFIPMTFLASLYGMNFKYMPELSWHYGYYIVLGIMLALAVGMLIYFWRKKWI